VGGWCVGWVSHMLRVSSSVSHLCTHTHTHTHSLTHMRVSIRHFRGLYSIFSLFCFAGVAVNLSQFPPLIIIKKRKLLHSPLNTPTRLLLLLALQPFPDTFAARPYFRPRSRSTPYAKKRENLRPFVFTETAGRKHFNLPSLGSVLFFLNDASFNAK